MNSLPLTPGLYLDEANGWQQRARGYPYHSLLERSFKPFYAEDNGREGLYVNAVAVLIKSHRGDSREPWILPVSPPRISGILTVLGIYFLAAELFRAGDSAFLRRSFSRLASGTSIFHGSLSGPSLAPLFLSLTWSVYLLF